MAILTNKNALKKALTVILCILLAIFMPVIAIVSFFSGGISVDTAGLSQKIEAQLTAEERAKISKAEELLKKVESEMKKKKYTDDQILQSRVITVLFLQDKVSDKDFVKKLVGCFKKNQTTKNLISNINRTFGTTIEVEDYEKLMSTQGGRLS